MHNARHGLDGAGDLRRDAILAREFDLHLAPLQQHHDGDGPLPLVETACEPLDRLRRVEEDADRLGLLAAVTSGSLIPRTLARFRCFCPGVCAEQ